MLIVFICSQELGAVTGIFEADEKTVEYIDRRRVKKHKNKSIYFKPDDDAEYVESHIVDLSKVESFVAVYPSPDDVVPVSEMAGYKLDGTFCRSVYDGGRRSHNRLSRPSSRSQRG